MKRRRRCQGCSDGAGCAERYDKDLSKGSGEEELKRREELAKGQEMATKWGKSRGVHLNLFPCWP